MKLLALSTLLAALLGCAGADDLEPCSIYATQSACAVQADRCTWNGSTRSCESQSVSGPSRK